MRLSFQILFAIIVVILPCQVLAEGTQLTIKDLVQQYLDTDEESKYQECLEEIGKNSGAYAYELGVLNAHKALQYYSVSIDSVNKYLQLVDVNLEPTSEIALKLKYNRALGLAYAYDGKFAEAVSKLNQNISLAETHQAIDDLIIAYSDAAIPHYFSENIDQALVFWKKALYTALNNDKSQSAYNNALNVAMIYGESRKIDSAYKYKGLCVELSKSPDVDVAEEVFYLNMGVIEYYVEHYTEAIKYFDQAKKKSLAVGNQKTYIKAIANASSCYLELGDPQKSLTYLEAALEDVKSYQEKAYIVDLYSVLSRTHYDLGDYKIAYEYLDSSKTLKDELINETRTKQIAELQEQFKSVEKDKIIAEQELAYQNEKSEKDKEKLKNEIHQRDKWYLYLGLTFVALFGVFMYRRFKVSQSQRRIIEAQKEEVEVQKARIESQHHELEEIHQEVSDSIHYAEKLQMAILPDREDLINNLGNGFVAFRPKDVVSGDFYWTVRKENKVFFAAADCTGHGVPGAMVSVVCSNALNRAVNEMKLRNPGTILDQTRSLVIETFARSGKDVKDGMDIALCAIEDDVLQFSGANNPLWIVRKKASFDPTLAVEEDVLEHGDHVLIEVKSDRQPVGLYTKMEAFTEHQIKLIPGDAIYIFTDGFADQFGGENGKKFKYKPFKKILMDIQGQSMDAQKIFLEKAFDDWKGDFDQIDDVCIIGVQYH